MPRVTISITNKQPQPYRFPLEREVVSLGRGSDNDISIQSESVSVHHAKMQRVPGGYELRDLGSTNGLKVDGQKLIFVKLRDGMTVRIGEADFVFQLSDDELETLRQEAGDEEEQKTATPEQTEAAESSEKPATPQNGAPISPDMPRSLAGMGGGAIVMLLILAAVAFFVGMMIRFQKETGESLIDAMRSTPPAGETKGSTNSPQD